MDREQPYYSLKLVKRLIRTKGCHSITRKAQETAENDFGWKKKEIVAAIMKLQISHFLKRDVRYDNPSIHVDYYKARGLCGEDVYIHFRIEKEILYICSFKRI